MDINIRCRFGLKKKIDIIIRLRNGLKRVRHVRTVSCEHLVCCSLYFLGMAFLQCAIMLIILPIFCLMGGNYRCAACVVRAAWAFGVLFLLVFCEDAFLREGRCCGFYRWVSECGACRPSRGHFLTAKGMAVAWVYLRNKRKGRVGMKSEIYSDLTMGFTQCTVPFDPLDKKEGTI